MKILVTIISAVFFCFNVSLALGLSISKDGDLTGTGFDELGFNSSGLVGYWQFNGNAQDSSGQDNHGTVFGASAVVDRVGTASGALSFNGTSDYVLLDPVYQLSANNFTVAAWVKTAANGPVVGIKDGGPSTHVFRIQNGFICFRHYYNVWLYEYGAISVIDDQWHQLVWVNTGATQTMAMYVDGNVDVSGVDSRFFTGARYVDVIGKDWAGYFNGSIDEVKIFSRALSAAEVQAMYNHEKGKFSAGDSGAYSALTFTEDPALPVQMRSKKEGLTVRGSLVEE